ncbi:preprotein translocase subunit SecA [bacterium]|nr:preprotein translocase subunit SecA [bacterium]
MSFLNRWFGDGSGSALRKAEPIVAKVNALEESFMALNDDALKAKTAEFKARIASGESLDDLMPEAFAAVREASRRTLGQRHFDVQLIGGAVLHQGGISEMRTGEGKTLVATLPAYLNALMGKGVHVVTVNDYLSRRDAVWMGQVYWALGMTTGIINHEASYLYDPTIVPEEEKKEDEKVQDEQGSFKVVHEFMRKVSREEAYAADITYGTNNEYGFDYLRDNLEYDPAKIRQKNHYFAIVDEIDSILIDEARTPLIISAPTADAEGLYTKFAKIAEMMIEDEDYTIEHKHRAIVMTDAGIEKAEKMLEIGSIYTDAGIKYVHHLETAVRAKALYHRDKEYVVRGGEVVIVDEFTGRMQPGRRWSEGLHQAIEAKEGVAIQKESRTFASITFQNYFRLYEKLGGMTGTAATSSEEFFKVYGLTSVAIPTNNPPQRIDHEDFMLQTENGKFRAIAKKVKELHEKGQPVLVGTVSVEKNELLSTYFKQEGIPHEVLNAKNHEREGEIVAQAGKKGAVVIATNMAGRGVDIKLGGNPATQEEYDAVKNAGGLFVIGTERHEARRIDNQLRGRAGRQGDPGETQFYVSLEDSLMKIFASDVIKRVMGTFKIPEDEPIFNSMITRSLEKAQTRIEEMNFDSRKHVLAYDDVLNIQRKSIYGRRRAVLTGGNEAVDKELEDVTGMLLEESERDAWTKAVESLKAKHGEAFYPAVRRLLLQTVDLLWVEHLEAMEYLRSSVNLRAYGQRDPLVEYKKEGLRLFQGLEASFASHVASNLPNLFDQRPAQVAPMRQQESAAVARAAQALTASNGASGAKKYGRNDKVTITDGTTTEEMKYKKAEPLLMSGKWRIVK